ncbi:MAG: TetR/AcrR family transcriptional regulator [Raoultibacter sp.]|jgi:AcrR family transcriptional regulator
MNDLNFDSYTNDNLDRSNLDDDVRRCFIEAFKKLYEKNGMRGVSGSSLSAKAGYSRATLYRYFESVYDILDLIEAQATPYAEMQYLLENANTVGMVDITDGFLGAFERREKLIRLLCRHSDNNYLERLSDCIRPVFRAQAKRVYVLEEEEYDILAHYITSAKVGLLKLWAQGETKMGLGHMTQVADALLEGALWDRVDEAERSSKEGRSFERMHLEHFSSSHAWLAHRILYEY